MLPGIPGSAMCVQRFDDSLNSAIHTTYRISLRSSSLREPRDPLPKVVLYIYTINVRHKKINICLEGVGELSTAPQKAMLTSSSSLPSRQRRNGSQDVSFWIHRTTNCKSTLKSFNESLAIHWLGE